MTIHVPEKVLSRLVFVDTEATEGGCPGRGELTEFGAVHYATRDFFHGRVYETVEGSYPPVIKYQVRKHRYLFEDFRDWLARTVEGNPIFVTDNVAFDWQWINYHFLHELGVNPFGFSARRINDLYAGARGDFADQSSWKSLRITEHDHNPVNDAMGNCEAFERILKGEVGT